MFSSSFSALLTSGLALGLAGSASALQSTQFGSPNTISAAATDVAEISPADLDGDGDIDVVAALTSLDRVVWYQMNASGTFTQRILDSNMPNVTSVDTADLDGDGDMDVIAGAPGILTPFGIFGPYDLKVYRNNGGGSFTPLIISSGIPAIWNLTTDDIDGDGALDVVIGLGAQYDQIGWFPNQGNLSFGNVRAVSTGTTFGNEPRDVHTADVDGDGDTDVLACFYLSNEITWFRNNNGLGTSWTRIRIGGASGARNVRTADMNGDGTLDLVATSVGDRTVAWYRGTGGGNFAARQVISTQNSEYRGLHLADVDQDGDLDVFTTSETNNRVDWYENLGGGSFSSSYVITNSMTGANHVNSADMDGDGVLDILASAPGNNRVVWYENEFDPNALGTNYCTAALNSFGVKARMSAVGSNVVADNDLTLEAHDLPNNAIGIFLVGPDRANLPNVGGSAGVLCVGGSLGRFLLPGQVMVGGPARMFSLPLDLTQIPQGSGFIPVQPGETWRFTTWFRDTIFGIPTSNFADGFEITFQ